MGAGGEGKSGRADGQRWSDAVVGVHISALVCRRAGRISRHSAQTLTDSDTELCRQWCVSPLSYSCWSDLYTAGRLGLCLLFTYCQYCRKLRDTLMINNCKYQFIGYRYIGNCVFWHLEKISVFYDPPLPPTFGARFCRKFCNLYASIYGTSTRPSSPLW